MKAPPAITPTALASAAGRKVRKVQRKLHEAQAELHSANEVLVDAVPAQDQEGIEAAVEQNVAAELKVSEAVEELEIVKELLADADADAVSLAGAASSARKGESGQGLKSLIRHLVPKGASGA